ncbi:hypothetical protein T06_9410 [Trichinella sp. T6]|nr:hypothetical protein T06_9410 [Trichinella sp. T6]
MPLVYEDRAFKLKYTGKRRKGWECSKDKKWCKDSVSTNLDVTSMLRQITHMDTCPMDPHFPEQGVMGTLIQQVLSGNVTVGDLRRINKVYAEKQQRVCPIYG